VKILISGWPKTGKTTTASEIGAALGVIVRSTDDLIGLGWSEASEAAAKWLDEPGPWIIEGVAVPRAVRKWLAANPGRPPSWDRFIVLEGPHVALTSGQTTMGKGIDTVLREIAAHAPWQGRSAIDDLIPSTAAIKAKPSSPHTLHRLPTGDTVELSDEEFDDCVKEGFTRSEDGRCAAAWWLKHALPNLCGGDRVTLFHDYPQHEKHLLAASAGRVIEATPTLAEVDGHLEVIGMRGDVWNIEIYGEHGEPIDHSGQVVVTIDSAQGVGKTNSIVLATDKRDRRILAAFWDNTILHDDLARVAQMVAAFFVPRKRSPYHHDKVTIICEADGAGRFTAHELTFLGVPHELFWQSKNNNSERCVVQAKRRIEAKPHGAPLVLQEEADELQRDEKNQLKGRKDCVMMAGVANIIIDERPYEPPIDVVAEKDRRNRMSFQESLRDHDMSNRRGGRPKWGT
jgi:hypothetical protein